MTTPAIEFVNVSKTYVDKKKGHQTALKGLNLSIHQGDFFGLLGHNGAGKSTAINLISGVSKITDGSIKVMGHDLQQETTRCKRLLGVVGQEISADSFFALPLMLKIQSKLSGAYPDADWIDYLLVKLALKEHVKKTTRELSGGMKRRMMIARALVHKPKIIILDEPTAGVDVELRRTMWEFVSELHKMGMTVILTTHYLTEAEQFCNRLAILKQGEIVTLKTNRELLQLGSKPRVIYLFQPENTPFNNKEWFEKSTLDWQADLNKHGVTLKMSEESQIVGDMQGYSLSCAFEEKHPETLQQAIGALNQFCAGHGFAPSYVTTARPTLEDAFLKLAF